MDDDKKYTALSVVEMITINGKLYGYAPPPYNPLALCKSEHCGNKCCSALGSELCYPHTVDAVLKRLRKDAFYVWPREEVDTVFGCLIDELNGKE